jgi:hypothetical protein
MSMRDPELVNPLTEPSGSSVPEPDSVPVVSELLLLPDGRILAHHLTPELASFLRTLLDPKASTPEPESPTP